eukprot:4868662-Prymnesium_polylepis.1
MLDRARDADVLGPGERDHVGPLQLVGAIRVDPLDRLAHRVEVRDDDLHGKVGLVLGAHTHGLAFARCGVRDAADDAVSGEDAQGAYVHDVQED